MNETFMAHVVLHPTKPGWKTLSINAKPYYQTKVNALPVDKKVWVNISDRKPKRSLSQNNYLFGIYYPHICSETGEYDMKRLHARFKRKFLLTGEYLDTDGTSYYETKSTSDLNKTEFTEFIQNVYAETQIEPPPTDEFKLGLAEGEKIKRVDYPDDYQVPTI